MKSKFGKFNGNLKSSCEPNKKRDISHHWRKSDNNSKKNLDIVFYPMGNKLLPD